MQLFSYWTGPVSWMERLSVASAQAVGHEVTVYSHTPALLAHTGHLGCKAVAHAGDVLDDPSLERLRAEHPAHYTDHFRLAGLQQGLGTWVDLDLVFLKPIPQDPYIYGWEALGSVNNAVLRLPEASAVLADYRVFCRTRPFNVPWHPLGDRIRRRLKRVSHALQRKRLVAPLLGPATLTHFLRQHRLEGLAKPEDVFYPVAYTDTKRMAEPGFIESCLTSQTVAVHLWHSRFRKVFGTERPPCAWLESQVHTHAVRCAA
jgi:hypothetical protein